MNTIQLLSSYNSNQKSTADKIINTVMSICFLLWISSVLLYPTRFSFLFGGVAYLLAIFYSPSKNKERIKEKIKASIYCGDLNLIFNLNDKRTLQVIQNFNYEIQNDIEKTFGIKGSSILKILEEIETWKKYDEEKIKKQEFKETFENTPTGIGKMFEQINNLKKGNQNEKH